MKIIGQNKLSLNLLPNIGANMDTATLAGLQTAFARCCQVGRETGNEHFCLLDKDGGLLAERTGTAEQVDLQGFFGEQGRYGVHNHNKPYPISLPDILCATLTKITLYAVTLNGDKYWSSGLKMDLEGISGVFGAEILETKAARAQDDAIAHLQNMFLGMNKDTAIQATVHFFNLMLASSPFELDYHYELTPETEALFKQMEPILGPQGSYIKGE